MSKGTTMRVCDWMSPDPVTIAPDTTVREARRLLHYYGVRHLPVVERDRLVGMVSDRDVRIDERTLGKVRALDQLATPLGEGIEVAAVMSHPVHTVEPDQTIDEGARLMLSRRISALPVVDAEGVLVGMLTTTDCLLASLAPQPAV